MPRPFKSATIFWCLEEGVPLWNTQGVLEKTEEKIGDGGTPSLNYRSTRNLGGDDRCHATNLHEVGDSRDVCDIILFMWARLVMRQQMKE